MDVSGPAVASFEVVWGASAIAKAINRTERATFHMLETSRLPGASKVAGRWCFVPSVFFESVCGARTDALPHDGAKVAA